VAKSSVLWRDFIEESGPDDRFLIFAIRDERKYIEESGQDDRFLIFAIKDERKNKLVEICHV
jgi:hypothetical protein